LKKVFVAAIRERDWVDTPFLVRDKIMAMAKNGKPYMTLKLIDRSGEVEARVWDRVDEFGDQFGKDDFIRVQGKASIYLGKMQLVVQELSRLPEDQVDLADFLPVAPSSAAEMELELRAKVASMQSEGYLRRLLEAFLADEDFLQHYRMAPAAKSMHHAYLSGLLEHSLAVADLAGDICLRYPTLNRDLLLTGALLHDVGKVAELCYARSFDYTDAGKLLGHIVMGVEMVDAKARDIPGFPAEVLVMVKHLLLSHHGQYEYGSPKRPKTLEALVLNFIDDMDAKINGVRTHIEREPDNPSTWTSYHRLYDRYFYKGSPSSDQASQPEPPAAPVLVAKAPVAVADRKQPSAAEKRPETKKGFGFTLADQLRGKSLDLFPAEEPKE